jgi:hypothetical protein
MNTGLHRNRLQIFDVLDVNLLGHDLEPGPSAVG